MRILGISVFLFLISPGDSSVQPGLKITALVVTQAMASETLNKGGRRRRREAAAESRGG